jgi:hypothetical protein
MEGAPDATSAESRVPTEEAARSFRPRVAERSAMMIDAAAALNADARAIVMLIKAGGLWLQQH